MRRVITTRTGRKAHVADDCVASPHWVTLCGRWILKPEFLAEDHRLDPCERCQSTKGRTDAAAGGQETIVGWPKGGFPDGEGA